MNEVILTKPLMQFADLIAEQRNQKEDHLGAMTYGGVRGGKEAHLLGLYAEIAVAHYLDIEIDTSIYDNKGDDGIDLFFKGKPIAIKTTTYFDDPLLRVEVEHFKDDIFYIGTAIRTPKVVIMGWASSQIVKQGSKRRFVKNGPMNYVLSPEELRSVPEH